MHGHTHLYLIEGERKSVHTHLYLLEGERESVHTHLYLLEGERERETVYMGIHTFIC